MGVFQSSTFFSQSKNNSQSYNKSYSDESTKIIKTIEGYQINTQVSTINDYQYDYLMYIIKQKSNLLNNHILSIRGYQEKSSNQIKQISLCTKHRQFLIFHQFFDETLQQYYQRTKDKIIYSQSFIYYIIFCISDALNFINQMKKAHGDVSLKKIVKANNKWKLIDRQFSQGSITAYQRVLLGKVGLISPQQIQKIRQGYIRQSPILTQLDDVFSFGMVILQLLTRKSSIQCYHQTYLRFQVQIILSRLNQIKINYSQRMYILVKGMINSNKKQRLLFKDILNKPQVLDAKNIQKLRIKDLKDNLRTNQTASDLSGSFSPKMSIKRF